MLESVNAGNIDPLEGSGYALAGYVKHKPLSQLEMKLLRVSAECNCVNQHYH